MTVLYAFLIVSVLALLGVAVACWVHVRRHMQHAGPSDTLKHVALHEAELEREKSQEQP